MSRWFEYREMGSYGCVAPGRRAAPGRAAPVMGNKRCRDCSRMKPSVTDTSGSRCAREFSGDPFPPVCVAVNIRPGSNQRTSRPLVAAKFRDNEISLVLEGCEQDCMARCHACFHLRGISYYNNNNNNNNIYAGEPRRVPSCESNPP
jgi:hypothetical protein